jgi:hypothetical protein
MCKVQWSIRPRKKLLGKGKKSFRQSFQVSLAIRPNLRDEIHFKEVGL